MTKSQTFYYISAVIIITLAAYLYTSVVEAPHSAKDTATEDKSSVAVEENPSPVETKYLLDELVSTTPTSLAGTSWRWLRTENASGTIATEPKSDRPFILSFGATDSMGSMTDCNTIGGSYKVDGDKLAIGQLMATLMFCENSKEAEYSAELVQVNSYAFVDNTLRLGLHDGGTMFFVYLKE